MLPYFSNAVIPPYPSSFVPFHHQPVQSGPVNGSEMLCFALILMQTLGPNLALFPEAKIILSVCAQSHFKPRQTLLIWRLLAPTRFLLCGQKGEKNRKSALPGVEAREQCARLSDCVTYGCCRFEIALSPGEYHLSFQAEPPDWWRWLSLYRCQG